MDSPFGRAQTVLMQNEVPYFVAASGRRFAAFPVAVLVFIVNPMSRELLLFESPAKRGRDGWEVVSGAVEHGETLIDAVHREVKEEAGADVRIDVLGAVHAWNWHYDHLVPNMISAAFVASYLGGDVTPGDDLAGSDFRWASLGQVHQLASAGVPLIPGDVGLFDRALQCFDIWGAVKP